MTNVTEDYRKWLLKTAASRLCIEKSLNTILEARLALLFQHYIIQMYKPTQF